MATKMRKHWPDTDTVEGRALSELRIAYRSYLRYGTLGYRDWGHAERSRAESLAYVISGRSGYRP